MKEMDSNLRKETVRWQEKLFKRSVRRRRQLREIKELIGLTTQQTCLEITAGDGLISSRLREGGGRWKTLTLSEAAQNAVGWFVPDAEVFTPPAISDPDGTYNLVLIVDALERIRDDYAFIKECHRVLKPDGRLVITAARRTVFGLGASPLRALLGLSWRHLGMERPGYTNAEFFEVIKDGFDVPETDAYATALTEVPGLICEAAANRLAGGLYNMPGAAADSEQFYLYTRLNALATAVYPLLWLCDRLEELLWFLPGHRLVAKSKRRVWRARRQPVLTDGRSIAEAVINTKIGTAAPF